MSHARCEFVSLKKVQFESRCLKIVFEIRSHQNRGKRNFFIRCEISPFAVPRNFPRNLLSAIIQQWLSMYNVRYMCLLRVSSTVPIKMKTHTSSVASVIQGLFYFRLSNLPIQSPRRKSVYGMIVDFGLRRPQAVQTRNQKASVIPIRRSLKNGVSARKRLSDNFPMTYALQA